MTKERRYEESKRKPKILKAVNMEDEENGATALTYRDEESTIHFDEKQII